MRSAFFYFQSTLNKLLNNCIKLYYFRWDFFKIWRGRGGSVWHPSQKKILSKSPALSGLMLFFSILGGISPFLVPFLESKFKISFLRSISLTLLIFQLDLEQKFGNLLPWILFWFSFQDIHYTFQIRFGINFGRFEI